MGERLSEGAAALAPRPIRKRIHRAGGAFVHPARRPSASAYGLRAELRP